MKAPPKSSLSFGTTHTQAHSLTHIHEKHLRVLLSVRERKRVERQVREREHERANGTHPSPERYRNALALEARECART